MIVYTGAVGVIWSVTRAGNDGEYVAALTDSAVVVWHQSRANEPLMLEAENEGRVHAGLVASPDGQWMASFGAGHLWCWKKSRAGWEPYSHEEDPGLGTARFTGPGVLDVVATRDGRNGTIEIHQLRRHLTKPRKKPELVAKFDAPEGVDAANDFIGLHYFTIDLSQDGRVFLLSPCERFQYVWNTAESRLLGSVKMRTVCNEGRISPDGTMFAVDAGTTVYLYRVDDLQLHCIWKVKHCYSPHVSWSPDGRRLLRADTSTTVKQFDLTTQTELPPMGVRGHRATAIHFSADGLTYVVGTFKGDVAVWDAE